MTSLLSSEHCERTMPRQSVSARTGGNSHCSTCTVRPGGATGVKCWSGQVGFLLAGGRVMTVREGEQISIIGCASGSMEWTWMVYSRIGHDEPLYE